MTKFKSTTIKSIAQTAYDKGGVASVCDLANGVFKTQTIYTHCKPCESETPHHDGECLCCGQ